MAGEQTPAPTVFDEGVGKLKLETERFPAGNSFCVRLPRDNCGVAVDAHFHVVILENLHLGSLFFALPISSVRVVILPIESVGV